MAIPLFVRYAPSLGHVGVAMVSHETVEFLSKDQGKGAIAWRYDRKKVWPHRLIPTWNKYF